MKFAVIGEGVIDRFLSDTTFTDVIGGSGLNTAISAKRAGLDVQWISLEANDDLGRKIQAHAVLHGVLSETRSALSHPTPLVEVRLAPDGSPTYEFKIENAVDWQWTDDHLQILSEYDVLHLTSLSAVLQPGADAIYRFLQAKPTGLLVTFDPNVRPSALKTEQKSFVKLRIEAIVPLTDVVKVSEEDLQWIAPLSVEETAAKWSTLGPQFVIVTRAALGVSLFFQGKEYAHIPSIPVNIVDTVGAGDTFMAWILRSFQTHGALPSLEQLTKDLDLAVRAAAITCTRRGCNPPTYLEILES